MSMAAIRRAGAPHGIETLAAFQKHKGGSGGVIVIADGTRPPAKAHTPGCSFVKSSESPNSGDDTAASVLEHGSTTQADAWVTATRQDRTMEASELDVLGPVDYLVVEFPADKANFSGAMATPTRPRSAQRS